MNIADLKEKFKDGKGYDLDRIINASYRDIQLRTIKGHTPLVQRKCTEYLKQSFEKILDNPSCLKNFDTVHKKLCNGLLELLNESENNIEKQEYGKAQKVINIVFKFLVAYDKLPEQYVAKCHMPIDSFVLKWIYNADNYQGRAWSYITEADYAQIQKDIKAKIKKEFKICNMPIRVDSRIEADFYVWYITKVQKNYKDALNSIINLSNQIDVADVQYVEEKVIRGLIKKNKELSNKLAELDT